MVVFTTTITNTTTVLSIIDCVKVSNEDDLQRGFFLVAFCNNEMAAG